MLISNKNAFIISLGGNSITSKGISILLNVIKDNVLKISEIHIGGNYLDDEIVRTLCECIKCNQHITSVDIGQCKITDKGMEVICDSLAGNTSLRSFGLSKNKGITNNSIINLVKLIDSSSIIAVNIYGTLITQKNLISVALAVNRLKNGVEILEYNGK